MCIFHLQLASGNVDAGDIVLETSGSHGDSGGMRFTSVSSSLEAQGVVVQSTGGSGGSSGSAEAGGIRLETSAGTGSVPVAPRQ